MSNKDYNNEWRKLNPQVENGYVKGGNRVYANMKQRCENPNNPLFVHYGERGIRVLISKDDFLKLFFRTNVCELCGQPLNDENRWASNGRSIDRIDVNKSYEESNLRVLCKKCNSTTSRSKPRRMRN